MKDRMSKHEQKQAHRDGSPRIPDWAVTADRVTIREDEYHILHVKVGDEEFSDVRPRRAFPLSSKSDYVSFLTDRDTEVVLLTDPRNLDRTSRKALERALDRVYYTAQILRVDKISEAMGVSMWEVLTNRGYAKFEIVDRQRFIHILPGGRYLITDVDGNRFEIEDISRLDAHSRSLIETET